MLAGIRPFPGTRQGSLSILPRIVPFPGTRPDSTIFGTHIDSTLFRYSSGQYFNSRTDSTFSRYSPGFYNFSVLTQIRPISTTPRCRFSILGRILPFPDTRLDSTIFSTHTDSTMFRYSSGQYFYARRASTFSRYTPRSTIFWYSHRFDPFPVLPGADCRYSDGFYLFPLLAWILPFFGTHTDSTLFQYSPG